MNEAEWLACDHPVELLEFLRGKASDRKRRLLLCSCSRLVSHLVVDPRVHIAARVAEQFADGSVSGNELRSVRVVISDLLQEHLGWRDDEVETLVSADAFWPHFEDSSVLNAGAAVALIARRVIGVHLRPQVVARDLAMLADLGCREKERQRQSVHIRDIFNPFRPSVVDASWLLWSDGIISTLAEGVYANRDFDRLPILADALEDAGCDNADVLAHCRQPGEHVRGCWVIDLLLGKS